MKHFLLKSHDNLTSTETGEEKLSVMLTSVIFLIWRRRGDTILIT